MIQDGQLLNSSGGKWKRSRASEFLDVRNPATAETMVRVPLSSAAEVDEAVQAAQAAFPDWRRTPPVQRIQYLFKLKRLLDEHFDEIARLTVDECGKTMDESRGELRRGVENVEVATGIPTLMQGYNSEDIAAGIDEHMFRQPVGVVAAITPFNFPGMIPLWYLPYALACGNCFILKPSEKVPMTMSRVFDLIDELDLPPGVVSLVNGSKGTVDALLDHPGVRAISFVGSSAVAKYVYSRAAANGKRAQCAGGAKNPVVVLPDADMDMATRIIADSSFGCAGQRCLATSASPSQAGKKVSLAICMLRGVMPSNSIPKRRSWLSAGPESGRASFRVGAAFMLPWDWVGTGSGQHKGCPYSRKKGWMKAIAIFPKTREVKLIDHEEPKITTPTQVKLRTLEVGVCGTDKKITSFQFGTPPAGYEYLVIGHEMLGEVVEVGSQVRDIKLGDLAVTMVRHLCPHEYCRACRMGRQDFCFTGDFTEHGIKEEHGFMTELVVDEERYLNLVPRELRDVAVLTEPLTVAEKGIAQVWQIQQRLPWIDPNAPVQMRGKGLKALVLGAGTVGLLGAMALVAAGFETYVYSRAKVPNPKADLVEAIGGNYISSETTSVEQLAEQIGTIDLGFEAAGASQIVFDVMRVLGTNAIFVFAGVPDPKAPTRVDTERLILDHVLKNQVVLGTVNADKAAFEAAIRDLSVFKQRWPQALRSLITGYYPIEQAPQLLLGSARGIKNVVTL